MWFCDYVMIELFATLKREKMIIIRSITRRFDEIFAFYVVLV